MARVTLSNKHNRMLTAGFRWSYDYNGYKVFYNGRTIAAREYNPLVKSSNSTMTLKHGKNERAVECFRLIAIGIAEIEFNRLLAQQNGQKYEVQSFLDWSEIQ